KAVTSLQSSPCRNSTKLLLLVISMASAGASRALASDIAITSGPRRIKMPDFNALIPNAPQGRFDGIERPYSVDDVRRLRGSFRISHTIAERTANRLWQLLQREPYVASL